MSERVDYPPRVREAVDELMCKKDATENRMSEYIVDYRWLQSRLFGQAKHLRDDLTKIVRCRDCKHYTEDDMEYYHYCGNWCGQVEPDGFCAWGEPIRNHLEPSGT